MKREVYKKLLHWKQSKRRKPLLIQGARQVGKTWLIQQFGKKEYDNFIYLNFEQNTDLATLFQGNLSPHKIIENIGLFLGEKIEATNTLLCFDEIQAVPEAITSLKYFYELAPEFHLIAAGSLLGVQLGKTSSFPVGKVNFLTVYPLSFSEYLQAIDEELLQQKILKNTQAEALPALLHNKLEQYLKRFLYLGGMPEVVNSYIKNKDIEEVRTIQKEILQAYQLDFSKYTEPKQAIKTSEFWRAVPNQLAKENKKFKYSEVKNNARASTYEQTIVWLENAGLIHICANIKTPKLPLNAYVNHSKFKVYSLDTGLLGAMLGVTSDIIVQPNTLFTEYNGAFIENFVATELLKYDINGFFYWSSNSDAEVDFIIQFKDKILPLEVKSGKSRNTKSIRSYANKFLPLYLLRSSARNFTKDNDFINIPLYGLLGLPNLLNELYK